jgi:GT2 family glycosyltransferase
MDHPGTVHLSFVIPVRDDAYRLRRCLGSIHRAVASSPSTELFVVDNQSSDGSGDVARDMGALVLVATGRVSELRNLGAAHASGEILAFVDADHEIGGEWLKTAFEAMSDPCVGAAGAQYVIPSDANWVQRRYDTLRSRSAQRHDTDWLGSGNLVIRRDVFKRLGGFDTTLETCEDVDLCNRVRAAGYRIVSDPGLLSVHFGDPASLRSLFFGELWRGRDNLRVTLRGPYTIRHLKSIVVPAVELFSVISLAVAVGLRSWRSAALSSMVVLVLAAVRAGVMVTRAGPASVLTAGQTLLIAFVYDIARALALIAGGSHRVRRSSEPSQDVTPDSHS